MQTIICMISIEEEEKMIEIAIKDKVLDMAYDGNATHVLQKLLTSLSEEKLDYVFYPVMDDFVNLSMDANGLCVLKKVIGKFIKQDK